MAFVPVPEPVLGGRRRPRLQGASAATHTTTHQPTYGRSLGQTVRLAPRCLPARYKKLWDPI